MRPADDGARHRADHLECDGRRDRQHGRPYHPRQDIQARQSLSALSVRAGSLGRIGQGRPKHWDRYGLKSWIGAAKKRLHHNVLAIALANKLARISWAVLNKERKFECIRTNKMSPRAA